MVVLESESSCKDNLSYSSVCATCSDADIKGSEIDVGKVQEVKEGKKRQMNDEVSSLQQQSDGASDKLRRDGGLDTQDSRDRSPRIGRGVGLLHPALHPPSRDEDEDKTHHSQELDLSVLCQ